MAKLPSFNPIEFLTGRRFQLTYGSLNNSIHNRWRANQSLSIAERAVIAEIKQFQKELAKKPPAEIAELVEIERAAMAKEKVLEDESRERSHRFNQPPALADLEIYDYWSKAAYWQLDEAAALLAGRNPKVVNTKSIRNEARQSRIAEKFSDVWELLSRAITARQIDFTLGPGGILAWAKRSGVEYPKELESAVLRNGKELKDWKVIATALAADVDELRKTLGELEAATPPVKQLGTREREGYLKLIIGMAIDYYGYDPTESKSPLAAELSGNLQRLGISISDDTIRNYLKQAKALLPRDTPEER